VGVRTAEHRPLPARINRCREAADLQDVNAERDRDSPTIAQRADGAGLVRLQLGLGATAHGLVALKVMCGTIWAVGIR